MFSHPFPDPARFENVCASVRKAICMCLVACGIALLFNSPAHAQGGVPLVTVATDQSPLNLSNQFGIPAGSAINQAGDFAFVGNGNSALFFRASKASTATRLLQVGDQVFGFPASQILSFSSSLRLNSTRVLFFAVTFSLQDGLLHEALLTYDGVNYHTVTSSDDVAPGSGGATYGINLVPVGLNDKGDVAFTAAPPSNLFNPFNPLNPLTTLYIATSGGATVRVAGDGDTLPQPPEPCPGGVPSCFFSGFPFPTLVILSDLNIRGEVLFKLAPGLFIGSAVGVSPVTLASSGPCASPSFLSNGVLNNAGVVAFTNSSNTASAICVAPPAGGGSTIAIVTSGDSAPPPIASGTLASPFPLAINNAGDVLFQSAVSASTTTLVLLRYRHSAGATVVDVVAYNGEPAPGTINGNTFTSTFFPTSMANDGRVSFKAFLMQGRNAIYQQSGADAPALIVLDGQPAPSSVGGTFDLSRLDLEPLKALDNGSTLFASGIANGAAYFAEFISTSGPGSIQPLMSTADSLPSGSRISLLSARPKAAGHFVVFAAQQAGGRIGLVVSDTSSGGTTAKLVNEGEPAPTTGGVISSTVGYGFFVNAKGQVALEAPITGGASPEAIFIWSQTAGLSKVAAVGEPSPIAGSTFLSLSISDGSRSSTSGFGRVAVSFGSGSNSTFFSTANPGLSSLLNDSGQLAFSSGLISGTTPSGAVFLYDPSGTIAKIAATGDLAANGETLVRVGFADGLDSAGLVAFEGESIPPSSTPGPLPIAPGPFVGSVGAMPQKVGFSGISSSGSSFDLFIGLADSGDLAFENFTISGTSQPGFGVFNGKAGGSAQTIAVNGGAAPGGVGGTFSLGSTNTSGSAVTTVFTNIARIDSESDVAFRGGITGGSSDSGYFRFMQTGPGAGKLLPVVLQGQAVPGGGTFDTIPMPNSIGENFTLGPDGELTFLTGFTSGSSAKRGLFVARADGSVLRVLATGDIVPGGGVADLLAMSHGLGAGEAGKFAFWAGIGGGSARQAIFVTTIPAGAASTTTTVSSSPDSPTSGQQITLTAGVSSTATGTPSGSVSFFDNGVPLGSGAVNSSGQAAFNTSSLPAGAHPITAQYSGDTNFAPSSSSAFTVNVTGFAPPRTNLKVTAGNNLVVTLTLYGAPGSNLSFTLSCSSLPANTSCAFLTPNPVVPGPPPNGTMVQLILSTMAGSKLLPAEPRKGPWPFGALGLSAILSALLLAGTVAFRQAPRRRLAFSMCLAVFALALAMVGCAATSSSGSGSPGTPKGPAAFTVTGTSGTTTVTTVVNVTVQ